jgi:hypothetical protein
LTYATLSHASVYIIVIYNTTEKFIPFHLKEIYFKTNCSDVLIQFSSKWKMVAVGSNYGLEMYVPCCQNRSWDIGRAQRTRCRG